MTLYYFDASAVVKHYVLEPGSTWIRALIDAVDTQRKRPIHTIFIADISVVEVAAAFAVLHRTGRIRQRIWDGAIAQFMYDITSRYQLVHTDLNDFFTAATLTQKYPLKAYDAIQLSVAGRYNQVLAAHKLSLTFVSGDKTLLTAAQGEMLATDNPFGHISPSDSS
jgi:predicted nucleic acid-binding protein